MYASMCTLFTRQIPKYRLGSGNNFWNTNICKWKIAQPASTHFQIVQFYEPMSHIWVIWKTYPYHSASHMCTPLVTDSVHFCWLWFLALLFLGQSSPWVHLVFLVHFYTLKPNNSQRVINNCYILYCVDTQKSICHSHGEPYDLSGLWFL